MTGKCIYNDGQVNNIDWAENIAIVDLSYMTYARFYAVKLWYLETFPEKKGNMPPDYNWTADEIFMQKFKQIFTKKLFEICYQRNIPISNIVFVTDCHHVDNWRVIYASDYKATRKDSHVKQNFHNFDIFPIIKDSVIYEMQKRYGNLVLRHNNLEADDIVYLLIRAVANYRQLSERNIFIVANDRDYVQLCDLRQIHLIDLSNNDISDEILSKMTVSEFLLQKIICGDVSDNILACYIPRSMLDMVGIKTGRQQLKGTPVLVKSILSNVVTRKMCDDALGMIRQGMRALPTENISIGSQFTKNAILADMANIPKKYGGAMNNIFYKCGIICFNLALDNA